MILTLIFVALIIIGVVLFIVGLHLEWDHDLLSEVLKIAGVVQIVIGACASIICVAAIICTHCQATQVDLKVRYEQQVTELTSTRKGILTLQDDYARSVATQQYNTEVRKFKTEILQAQVKLTNPWICWFESPIYNDFDANIVSYIE